MIRRIQKAAPWPARPGPHLPAADSRVPEGIQVQLKALENLVRRNVRMHPACMTSFSTAENSSALKRRLLSIHNAFDDFEVEELILYPAVAERIRKRNLPYHTAHRADQVLPEQV